MLTASALLREAGAGEAVQPQVQEPW